MDAVDQQAAFEAQEARLRKIEIKIPREWTRDQANKALRDALQGRVVDDAAVLVSAVAVGLDSLVAIRAKEELMAAIQKRGPKLTGTLVLDGLHLSTFPSGVVNLAPHSRSLVKSDVDTLRIAFADLGLAVVDEWLATQGASWLSDGVTSVSFQVEEDGR